ncbi:hypothetical protein K7432_003216 [Basidiobolus ranarum]|uniref:Uncharacterized protein n=1 Tax=Basidiobolus ranarum TaxID=34480 RepID=A0ABR2W6Y9_9FUNG
MLAARNLLATIAVLVYTVSAVPVDYFSYGDQPCTLQFGLCAHRMQPQLMKVKKHTRFPMMKQSFGFATRKHHSLNTAMASSKRGMNIKYQAGPHAEVESEHTSSAYGKYMGMKEPAMGEEYQSAMMMPMQGEYSASSMKPKAHHSSEMYKESMEMPMAETSYTHPKKHHTWEKPKKHHTWEKPKKHHTSEKPKKHHTWEKPKKHHTSEKPKKHHHRESMEMPTMEKTMEMPTMEKTMEMPMMEKTTEMPMMEKTMEQPMVQEEYSRVPGSFSVNLENLKPSEALLDRASAHSSQKSRALSDSNQFDQTQVLDQTMYQIPQQQAPQVIIPYMAMHRPARPFKKYRKYGHRSYKIRYFSGKHY